MQENDLELDRLFFKADNDIKDGNIVEAFDNLTYIIEQDLEYGRAYNHLGWIYETKYKNYAKAEECYRLAMKYSPDYLPIYLNFAILLSTLEKFDELEAHLEKAFTISGINKAKIWNEYGIMYEMKSQFESAIQAYKKAVEFSLVNEDIDVYEQSIERCRKKQRMAEL
jgi:tetratricopeptide (TPR) repeat protein